MHKNREAVESTFTQEKVSEKFNLASYFEARDLAIQIVQESSKLIEIGMSEQDGLAIIENKMSDYGIEKKWHPTKFRIGKNTLCSFRELSDDQVRVAEDDIFFFDIGPVFKGHEADYGETFTIGHNNEFNHLKTTVKHIFHDCNKAWKENNLSGKDLYAFAELSANAKGCVLNMNMKGHRLGDFPHHLYHRGSLEEFEHRPIENLWVLEILISDKKGTVGAFFEDIIY